jgi:hypothetical protein
MLLAVEKEGKVWPAQNRNVSVRMILTPVLQENRGCVYADARISQGTTPPVPPWSSYPAPFKRIIPA